MKNLLLVTALAGATFFPMTASAEKGDFLVRARGILVAPTEETSDVLPALPGASVEVDNAVVPELDFTYFLADRFALELILATSPHDLEGTGGIEALGTVADVWVLPPTLTLQYHFAPEATFRPYVGVGLNYTLFYGEDASGSLNDALGDTDVEVDDSFGIALQAGADVAINENWFVNADIKYIQIDTDATLTTGSMVNEVEVDLDPVVFGLGLGRRF
jgi:outer membrane protein